MHKQITKNNFILTNFPNTDYLYERILVLPSSTNLQPRIIKKISNLINRL